MQEWTVTILTKNRRMLFLISEFPSSLYLQSPLESPPLPHKLQHAPTLTFTSNLQPLLSWPKASSSSPCPRTHSAPSPGFPWRVSGHFLFSFALGFHAHYCLVQDLHDLFMATPTNLTSAETPLERQAGVPKCSHNTWHVPVFTNNSYRAVVRHSGTLSYSSCASVKLLDFSVLQHFMDKMGIIILYR